MERWTAFHFSQANPAGQEQADIPALLRRVADTLDGLPDVEVLDITFRHDMTSEGDHPSMTVYDVDIAKPS